jgi:hypothetical protein
MAVNLDYLDPEPLLFRSSISSVISNIVLLDPVCGLVVRVPGYISRGPRFDSQRVAVPGLENRD